MKLWLLRKLNAWSAKRLAVQSSELLAVRLGRAHEALRDIRERVEHCQTRERLDSELHGILNNYWQYERTANSGISDNDVTN